MTGGGVLTNVFPGVYGRDVARRQFMIGFPHYNDIGHFPEWKSSSVLCWTDCAGLAIAWPLSPCHDRTIFFTATVNFSDDSSQVQPIVAPATAESSQSKSHIWPAKPSRETGIAFLGYYWSLIPAGDTLEDFNLLGREQLFHFLPLPFVSSGSDGPVTHGRLVGAPFLYLAPPRPFAFCSGVQ
jgi:hypothetical protein